MKQNAVIVDAVRTPIGRYGGALKDVRPDDLAALVIRSLLERNPDLPDEEIDDVIFGCTNQAGEDNRNVARMAIMLAGLPFSVPGQTVNRLCASGMDAVNAAANAIMADMGDIYIAGGVESMSRAPMVMAKPTRAFPRGAPEIFDSTIGWRFTNPKMAEIHEPVGMGITAENVAKRYEVSREDQDAFAHRSQQNWQAANAREHWKREIVPVSVPQRKADPILVDTDEHPRPDVSLEKMGTLRPAFVKEGTVTAGNSSGINDGASALLILSEEKARLLNLKPLARIIGSTASGVDPDYMGIGPIPATLKLLKRIGLKIEDFSRVELNEAFASQALVCIRELGLDPEIVNVNGGAIAMGHPLGATGARIMTTLVHELASDKNFRYGLATLCVGVGQGVATVIENLNERD